LFGRMPFVTLEDAEKRWNKEQRRNRRENQSTNDRPAEGSICSPPSPSPRAMGTIPIIMAKAVISTGRKTREACFQCGAEGIFSFRHFFGGKAYNQDCCWRWRRPCT